MNFDGSYLYHSDRFFLTLSASDSCDSSVTTDCVVDFFATFFTGVVLVTVVETGGVGFGVVVTTVVFFVAHVGVVVDVGTIGLGVGVVATELVVEVVGVFFALYVVYKEYTDCKFHPVVAALEKAAFCASENQDTSYPAIVCDTHFSGVVVVVCVVVDVVVAAGVVAVVVVDFAFCLLYSTYVSYAFCAADSHQVFCACSNAVS